MYDNICALLLQCILVKIIMDPTKRGTCNAILIHVEYFSLMWPYITAQDIYCLQMKHLFLTIEPYLAIVQSMYVPYHSFCSVTFILHVT